jgi:hypothetical protein
MILVQSPHTLHFLSSFIEDKNASCSFARILGAYIAADRNYPTSTMRGKHAVVARFADDQLVPGHIRLAASGYKRNWRADDSTWFISQVSMLANLVAPWPLVESID